jgi:hypothetical protein
MDEIEHLNLCQATLPDLDFKLNNIKIILI